MMESFFECKYSDYLSLLLVTGSLKRCNLIVLGDSHTFIFNKIEGCLGIKLGSFLAHSVGSLDQTHISQKQIVSHINTLLSHGYTGPIGLMFGEIDCRCHIIRLSHKLNISVEEICKKVAQNYIGFLSVIRGSLGHRLVVITPPVILSGHRGTVMKDMPQYGSDDDILRCSLALNAYIKMHAEISNIECLDLTSWMKEKARDGTIYEFIDANNLHLSHHALPTTRHLVYQFLNEYIYRLNNKKGIHPGNMNNLERTTLAGIDKNPQVCLFKTRGINQGLSVLHGGGPSPYKGMLNCLDISSDCRFVFGNPQYLILGCSRAIDIQLPFTLPLSYVEISFTMHPAPCSVRTEISGVDDKQISFAKGSLFKENSGQMTRYFFSHSVEDDLCDVIGFKIHADLTSCPTFGGVVMVNNLVLSFTAAYARVSMLSVQQSDI